MGYDSRKKPTGLKPCPHCKSINNLVDAYVYIRCDKCHMRGPAVHGGVNDDHVDYIDHERAKKLWNSLPRQRSG